MKDKLKLILLAGLVAAGGVAAHATTIDFEAYADGANINGVNLGGVTLTAPGGLVEIYDNRFGIFFHSATKAVANLDPSPAQDNPLLGVFDFPVSYVSLWGGDGGGDTEDWTLEAYNGALLVRSVNSGPFTGNPYRQLRIDFNGITSFKAYHNSSNFGIGFDDLSFERSVPDSGSTLSLLGLAAAGLGLWRRRN